MSTGPNIDVLALLNQPTVLGGIGALVVLLVVLAFLLRKRRRHPAGTVPVAPPDSATRMLEGAPTQPEPEPPMRVSLLAPVAPAAGVPYLVSVARTEGVLFCPLSADSIRVGRGPDKELAIDHTFVGWETVSRDHATVTRLGDRWIVTDLGASNGVRVNGRRTGTNVLFDGAQVQFGQVAFTYCANGGGGVQ